jgi:hypothetical protein
MAAARQGVWAVSEAKTALSFEEVDRSTHFVFEHKLFQVKGARFAFTADGAEPAFYVTLGDLKAALRLNSLQHEFNIEPDSADGKLLSIVEKSLRFVKEIRPGDSIPREILDGTASWKVEERHMLIAQRRLAVQIASWFAGQERVVVQEGALEEIAENPETKARVNAAMKDIAEKLGLGADRRQEVLDRVDELARELSYIEALRERAGAVHMVAGKTAQLAKVYQKDRTVIGDIARIHALLARPFTEFNDIFAQVDAMTGEILSVLRKFTAQVQFVRQSRDKLHIRLMLWDPIIAQWEALELVRGAPADMALKELYRFAARHFPQQQDWRVAR